MLQVCFNKLIYLLSYLLTYIKWSIQELIWAMSDWYNRLSRLTGAR